METVDQQVGRPVYTEEDLRSLAEHLSAWKTQRENFVESMGHRLAKHAPDEALKVFFGIHFGTFDVEYLYIPLRAVPKFINDQKPYADNISLRAAIARWRLKVGH